MNPPKKIVIITINESNLLDWCKDAEPIEGDI